MNADHADYRDICRITNFETPAAHQLKFSTYEPTIKHYNTAFLPCSTIFNRFFNTTVESLDVLNQISFT